MEQPWKNKELSIEDRLQKWLEFKENEDKQKEDAYQQQEKENVNENFDHLPTSPSKKRKKRRKRLTVFLRPDSIVEEEDEDLALMRKNLKPTECDGEVFYSPLNNTTNNNSLLDQKMKMKPPSLPSIDQLTNTTNQDENEQISMNEEKESSLTQNNTHHIDDHETIEQDEKNELYSIPDSIIDLILSSSSSITSSNTQPFNHSQMTDFLSNSLFPILSSVSSDRSALKFDNEILIQELRDERCEKEELESNLLQEQEKRKEYEEKMSTMILLLEQNMESNISTLMAKLKETEKLLEDEKRKNRG